MRTSLLLALLLLASTAQSQQQLFIKEANALPRLYEKKDFDSIAWYIQLRWREPTDPDVLCQAILLSIQRNIFDHTEFPDLNSLTWPTINLLRAYANLLAVRQDSKCHLPEIDKQLFFTLSRWASDLLRAQPHDTVESFFLRVYSGDIRYPEEYLSLHAAAPPSNATFSPGPARLHRLGAVLTIGSGIWIPGGHLSLLGVHPAINYGFGIRTSHNEWDIDASLRFVNTPQPYTILRNDTLMSRTFYDGGNLNFSYTRYLVHHDRWEAGLSTGMGIDFIDFTSGSQTPDWSPTEITCFDFNLGLRCNYFFGRHGFVGFAARYHFLSYTNPGGSPFDGNAATFDIIVGTAGEHKR